MALRLAIKAYILRVLFNSFGWLGSSLLNLGRFHDIEESSNLFYGQEPRQCLDVLKSKASAAHPLPVLVYFHGGGWICADKRIYKGVAANFCRNGFLTFNVNYRLAPKSGFAASLQDAAKAIDWIYRNASDYGGDPSSIILAGDSAGAQIASWYASALQNTSLFQHIGLTDFSSQARIRGLLLFYGVYNFGSVLDTPFPFIRTYARCFLGADRQTYFGNSEIASPINQVAPSLPPILLCAGERDGLFAQSREYAEALEACGARYRTLFFPKECLANHGFLFFSWLQSAQTTVAAAVDFAHRAVRDADTGI